MATRPIRITGSNTATQQLTLDYPNREADSGDSVLWIVQPGSGIDSIIEIKEKDGYMNVWSTRPQGSNNWRGRIRPGVPPNYEYKYYIKWKKDGVTYTHDPKITINPSFTEDDPFDTSVVLLIIAGLTLTAVALLFWRKKKSKSS